MIISVINHTDGKLKDEQILDAIRAINRQISEDFEPYWSIGGMLRLEGRSGKQPNRQNPIDMRGDAIIYIWDKSDSVKAMGYHDKNFHGIPYGFVFTSISEKMDESWTATLSHESLEMLLDPEVNLLVAGPHPVTRGQDVFHWYEACDAVQSESYDIDGIAVSNFLLPLYFTGGDEFQGRNDFLGSTHDGKTLTSFGVNPGGYIGFFNPALAKHETFFRKNDEKAKKRFEIKSGLGAARRSIRYKKLGKQQLSQDI
ncbi:MAG: hypothetical protein DA330_01815 [Nitrososphaera sp.]|nr:hypothetical protein [Nitrososphaera sp.]